MIQENTNTPEMRAIVTVTKRKNQTSFLLESRIDLHLPRLWQMQGDTLKVESEKKKLLLEQDKTLVELYSGWRLEHERICLSIGSATGNDDNPNEFN